MFCRSQKKKKKNYQCGSVLVLSIIAFNVLPRKSLEDFNSLTGFLLPSCDISLESSLRALFKYIYFYGSLANAFGLN